MVLTALTAYDPDRTMQTDVTVALSLCPALEYPVWLSCSLYLWSYAHVITKFHFEERFLIKRVKKSRSSTQEHVVYQLVR